MIHADIFHFTGKNTEKFIRSHKLQPTDTTRIFCIIYGKKEGVVSVLEDHLLESISGIEWEKQSLDTDFSFISENFNHFIQNIDPLDMHSVGVLLAVLIDNSLVFCHTGETSILLLESNGDIVSLSNTDISKSEFHAISSGEIMEGSQIYLSSSPIENRLSDDLIRDLSLLNPIEWKNIITDLFKKEIQDSIHIGYISHTLEGSRYKKTGKNQQSDILRNGAHKMVSHMQIGAKFEQIKQSFFSILEKKNKETKYILLFTGIILLFMLVYFLFSAIFSVISSPERDTKNQLLQAKELIENSQKLVNNPQAFNTSIENAEKILFELRDKRVHMTDTQSLLSRIEAMKKEVNDIQSIDITKLPSIVSFSDANTTIENVSEYNKKLNIFTKDQAFIAYARGETLPKGKTYPSGEILNTADFSDDGSFYLLTEQGRVLSMRGSEISYVSTNGKNDWGNIKNIATFNGNIYTIGSGSESVIRYKPGINGFSSPSTIMNNLGGKIIDIGIDGGIYALLDNGKVVRYIGGSSGGQKNLNINKVPGEYNLGSEEKTEIFVRSNLSYIYILSGKNIWIFAPDSKRFQDVTAWNYIAQLELQNSGDDISSIYVPRDGTIYIVGKKSIHELGFEIADGKIILR